MQPGVAEHTTVKPALLSVWMTDDEETWCDTVGLFFSQHSDKYTFRSFGSAEEMLRELRNNSSADVFLLDIKLPGMWGVEAIEFIRQSAPSTPIIMLTVCEDDDNIIRSFIAGASGYLLKPMTGSDLLQAIEQAVKGGAPMSRKIALRVVGLLAHQYCKKKLYNLDTVDSLILKDLSQGKSRRQTAECLHMNFYTLNNRIQFIFEELGVNKLSAAVTKAIEEHLF